MNLKKLYDAVNAAQAQVNQVAAQIVALYDEGKNDEALSLQAKLDEAKKDYQSQNQMYLSMLDATSGVDPASRFVPIGSQPEPKEVKDMRASSVYMNAFFDALKSGVTPKSIMSGQDRAEPYQVLMAALSETGGSPAGEDGGFLLPVDFDNMIKSLKRRYMDLAPYFNVEEVTAYSGWRSIEQAAAALPFAAVTEGDDIPEMEQPKFNKVDYTIVDYSGYLPVQNGLLADTPVNVMRYLGTWIGNKTALTNTSRILALINALSATAIASDADRFAAIKTALNITLDPVISAGASIFTNQKGFDLLDQEIDGVGRPVLQPDPSAPTQYRVMGRPVVVVPSTQWANLTATDRARMAIGDGMAFGTLFRRAVPEIATTTVGGNAWRKNQTEVRCIIRLDEATMDSSAMALLTLAF